MSCGGVGFAELGEGVAADGAGGAEEAEEDLGGQEGVAAGGVAIVGQSRMGQSRLTGLSRFPEASVPRSGIWGLAGILGRVRWG